MLWKNRTPENALTSVGTPMPARPDSPSIRADACDADTGQHQNTSHNATIGVPGQPGARLLVKDGYGDRSLSAERRTTVTLRDGWGEWC
jgi:hypothetical protein